LQNSAVLTDKSNRPGRDVTVSAHANCFYFEILCR
jgi:uncharacterized heparinase superfamily protein